MSCGHYEVPDIYVGLCCGSAREESVSFVVEFTHDSAFIFTGACLDFFMEYVRHM